jgi:hypothetical protein
LSLHADWSWPFLSPSESSIPNVKSDQAPSQPPKTGVVKPALPFVPALPVKGQQSAPGKPLLTAPEVVLTGSVPVLSSPPRSLALFASAKKISSMEITEDALWSGTLLIDGMITLASQATLTIMPGTTIRFGKGSGILVLGRLVAKGTLDAEIILTSVYADPLPSDWYGIVLTGTSKKNYLEHAGLFGAEIALYSRSSAIESKKIRIEKSSTAIKLIDSISSFKEISISGCSTGLSVIKSELDLETVSIEKGVVGISVSSSSVTAEKLKVSSTTQSALVADKSHLKLDKSVFGANQAGVKVTDSDGTINKSRFISNLGAAVVLSNSNLKITSNLVTGNKIGIQLEDNLSSIWGNSVYANSSYNLLYLGDDSFYTGGNWFGTPDLDMTSKTIFSKRPGALQILPLLVTDPALIVETVL